MDNIIKQVKDLVTNFIAELNSKIDLVNEIKDENINLNLTLKEKIKEYEKKTKDLRLQKKE